MNLPHERPDINPENQPIKEPNAIIEAINNFRSSNATIKLAHAINIMLTFLFGYRFMPEVFFLFGEDTPEALIFAGAIAGLALIALFDLPYHAWSSIAERPGLSTEQIATAQSAATWSLRGSLASSVAAIVLSQELINMPQTILYGATGVGLIAVAWIAIAHMKWWDSFQKQGFDAKKRSEAATQKASALDAEIKRAKQIALLNSRQANAKHELTLQQIEQEQALEMQKLQAELEIKQKAMQQKLLHLQEVHKQAASMTNQMIPELSAKAAKQQAEELLRQFSADMGLVYEPTNKPNGVTKPDPKSN